MGKVKAFRFDLASPSEALLTDAKRSDVKKRISLSSAEHRVLLHLSENPDQDINRDSLVEVVSEGVTDPGSPPSLDAIRAVDRTMMSLRKKLGEASAHLKTVRGFGYRFASTSALEEEHASRPPHGLHED